LRLSAMRASAVITATAKVTWPATAPQRAGAPATSAAARVT